MAETASFLRGKLVPAETDAQHVSMTNLLCRLLGRAMRNLYILPPGHNSQNRGSLGMKARSHLDGGRALQYLSVRGCGPAAKALVLPWTLL